MREYVSIGSVPADEECEQIGPNFNPEKSRAELRAFKGQLERMFPAVRFGIKSFPHDFGSYSEVVAYYDSNNEDDASNAFEVENSMPLNWDVLASMELMEGGYLK